MRSSLILPALLLKLACLAPHAGAAPASAAAPEAVVATVTMRDARALEVSYRIPPSCKALTFENAGIKAQVAALVRRDWTPADDCAEIDFQSIRPRHAACTTLRLRVPATTRARDRRLYDGASPWAQPFGDGLYAHTSAYAVQDSCGPVEWRFEAPGGTVMADGVVAAQAATAARTPADGLPVLLLAQPYRPDAPAFHAEAQVDGAAQTLLAHTLQQSRRELQAMLPALTLRQGYVLAAAGNAPSLRSETPSPNVIRLVIPGAPLPGFQAQARALLAHESAHLAQPVHWREAWQDDLPAIREGGAELLRLAASVRLGWLTQAQLKDELEAALNSCLIAAEDKPWRAFEQRNDTDNAYRCGLALHLLGLARLDGQAGAGNGVGNGALRRLQDYYRRAQEGARTDFAQALECGTSTSTSTSTGAGCAPRRLARVRGGEPLAAIVRDEAGTPGSLLHAAPAWGPALVETMVFRHLEQLMRADCRGGANIAHDKAAPRIGPGLRCGVLRTGMVVTTAEGLPLFVDARAVKASAQACRRGGFTVLGLQDGRSVRVACRSGVALPDDVLGVDAARAMALTR